MLSLVKLWYLLGMSCCGAFRCGTFLTVGDASCRKCYKAKIVKINEEDQTLKVHFVGWNSCYDEVLSMVSP